MSEAIPQGVSYADDIMARLCDARHIARTKARILFPSTAARAGGAIATKTTQAVAFFLYLLEFAATAEDPPSLKLRKTGPGR